MKSIVFFLLFYFTWSTTWSQCEATVTISGPYEIPYTGSNSWIASSGVTIIPAGSNVTLDANPENDGFVLLNPGFETLPSAVFFATVETECSLLDIEENNLVDNLTIFPNPSKEILNIHSNSLIISTEIFDLNGRLIQKLNANSGQIVLNIGHLSDGMYLLKIYTKEGETHKKFIKN